MRVFLSTSVLAAAALKETWTGLSVTLCSAVLQQGRLFTMKGTGVSLTAKNTQREKRPVKCSCFEFLNKRFVSTFGRLSLHHTAITQCPLQLSSIPLPFLSCSILLGRLVLCVYSVCVSLIYALHLSF